MSFRLRITMIPEPLWGKNLRKELGKTGWMSLREELLAKRNSSECEFCGDYTDSPEAHEIWDYKEIKDFNEATLVDIKFICPLCHDICHLGRIESLIREGKVDKSHIQKLEDHFCRVNECEWLDFKLHQRNAKYEYDRRSALKWIINYGAFKKHAEAAKVT